MFYLGEYDEETAKEIKSYLDKAGLKVDTRSCLVMEEETTYTLKDKLSAVKELIEEHSQFEQYLSALKNVLPQATLDNFEDLFLKELDPLMMEKRDKILALSENSESLSPKEEESLKFGSEEWMNSALFVSRARIFSGMIFSLNDIKIGEAIENKLDDPIIEITVDPDDYEDLPEQMKCDIDFYLEKAVNIFVDEFTTPLAIDLNDEFWDTYPSEAQRLKVLGLLIEKLATSPDSRKMDFAEFAEECTMTLEDDSSVLNVYGDDVAEDLARVLEKSGVVKWKGDKLKWKSKD
jgi:mRNA-degrading endonuclease HigB of HigAB toxin-antitoxin module